MRSKVLVQFAQLFGAATVLSASLSSVSPASAANEICDLLPSIPATTIDQGPVDCWESPTGRWEDGTTYARGYISSTAGGGVEIAAYATSQLDAFPGSSALTRAFLPSGAPINDCVVSDSLTDGAYAKNSSSMCNQATAIQVTAGY